eukprot:g6571.t1
MHCTGLFEAGMESGASIDITDGGGQTPLNAAAGLGETEMAQLLLLKGAELDAFDNNVDCTPLYQATCEGHVSTTLALLIAGADVLRLQEEGIFLEIVKYLGSRSWGRQSPRTATTTTATTKIADACPHAVHAGSAQGKAFRDQQLAFKPWVPMGLGESSNSYKAVEERPKASEDQLQW